jgi:hypothetical protein
VKDRVTGREYKRVEEGDCVYTHEYGAMKPVQVILRRGEGENEGSEPNQGTIYVHMERSQ